LAISPLKESRSPVGKVIRGGEKVGKTKTTEEEGFHKGSSQRKKGGGGRIYAMNFSRFPSSMQSTRTELRKRKSAARWVYKSPNTAYGASTENSFGW